MNSKADFGAVLSAILGRGIAFCVGGCMFLQFSGRSKIDFKIGPGAPR